MEKSGADSPPGDGARPDSVDGEEHKQVENNGETSTNQSSRRPNLLSLKIPARSLESSCPPSTRINITSLTSPVSARSGLPPRPSSAKGKPSMRNLLPQRSFKTKNSVPECEKTVLIIPGTPTSEEPEEKPSTSRSFSLTKVFSATTAKRTNSLPVTPVANSGPESVHERDVPDHFESVVSHLQKI